MPRPSLPPEQRRVTLVCRVLPSTKAYLDKIPTSYGRMIDGYVEAERESTTNTEAILASLEERAARSAFGPIANALPRR